MFDLASLELLAPHARRSAAIRDIAFACARAAQIMSPSDPLRADLIDEAKRLDINVSQACEAGLAAQVAEARAEEWRTANREAVEYWNAYVEKHGLPLARYRQF